MTRLEILRGGLADPSGRRGASLVIAARDGTVVRLAPGWFVDAEAWHAASAAERHIARMEAVLARAHPRLVVSHASAVAVHGLPWVGEFPDRVTTVDPHRGTAQTRPGLVKLPGAHRRSAVERLGRRTVTTPLITGVDIALRFPIRTSVVVLDALLQRPDVSQGALLDALAVSGARVGVDRARDAISFADALSGSPGESLTRWEMSVLGAPAPILQQAFHDDGGLIGYVDFWFPDVGAVIEFDGLMKYSDPGYRSGRTAAEVVIDEKRREDRLRSRRAVNRVGRLEWRDLHDPAQLRVVLEQAGIPLRPVHRHRSLR